jgi:hypothetical protein
MQRIFQNRIGEVVEGHQGRGAQGGLAERRAAQ